MDLFVVSVEYVRYSDSTDDVRGRIGNSMTSSSSSGFAEEQAAQTVNYADDLKSIAGNLASLQEQANLVSAFALVFGLDQSKAKFWAFHFPFGTPDEHRNSLDQLSILTHTAG